MNRTWRRCWSFFSVSSREEVPAMASSERTPHPQQPAPSGEPSSKDRKNSPGHIKRQQRHSRRSVLQYLAILFAAAFLLLLLTYVMQQRIERAQDQIDDLQASSDSALQTLENIIAERDKLKEENQTLNEELEQAWQDVQESQSQIDSQERALQAMDWFWQIDEAYVRSRWALCRQLIDSLEQAGLVEYLPKESYTDNDRFSPYDRFQEIKEAVD